MVGRLGRRAVSVEMEWLRKVGRRTANLVEMLLEFRSCWTETRGQWEGVMRFLEALVPVQACLDWWAAAKEVRTR